MIDYTRKRCANAGAVLLFLIGFLSFASHPSRVLARRQARVPTTIPTVPYRFGVVTDIGEHHADLWDRGVRATTFELQWKLYEPQEGVYDQTYIDHMKQVLANLNSQGWYIQLIPGYHYAPAWVYANYPGVFFANQYGDLYDPDPANNGDFRVINAPFNPQARELIAGYLQRIFSVDFPQNDPALQFDSVRVGGGPQGELRYPPSDWNGHTNSYWAFDAAAQNPLLSGIPAVVVGWRPGIDPNPGSVARGQLIVNPGFEDDHTYLPLLGWSPDDEVTAEAVTGDSQSGARSLRLAISSPNRVHQYIRVQPNTTYQFGGWLKSASAGGRARLFVTQYGANTQPAGGAPFTKLETLSQAWVSLAGELTSSPSTAYLKVELDGDRPGTYAFDDLWLKKKGEINTLDRDVLTPMEFYTWYVKQLTAYQNWQIAEMRKYFSGTLDVVYAGKGIRQVQIKDALNNDLKGDGWSEASSGLYSASDYAYHVANINPVQNIAIYLTGIETPPPVEVDDRSPYPGVWSAARWLAYLARSRSLPIWGENTGANTAVEMAVTLERMRANDFTGILWAFESQLFGSPASGSYAAASDYESFIKIYSNDNVSFLPLTLAGR